MRLEGHQKRAGFLDEGGIVARAKLFEVAVCITQLFNGCEPVGLLHPRERCLECQAFIGHVHVLIWPSWRGMPEVQSVA